MKRQRDEKSHGGAGAVPEEVTRSWDEFWLTGSDEARNSLMLRYLPLVKYLSGRVTERLPSSVDTEDVMSAGVLGLLEAINRFDPSWGVKFETYAYTRIRGAMVDELRKMDWAPRSVREKGKKLEQTLNHLESKLGRQPSEVEIAEALDITFEEYHQMAMEADSASIYSLDQEIVAHSGGGTLYNILPQPEAVSPSAQVEQQELKELLVREIERLPEVQKLVIALYYYEELTMKEIGEVLNLSESRISQIHSKVVSMLRATLAPAL